MSQKWKAFENTIAKELSMWLFGQEKILRRAPCSGGWLSRGADGDIIVAHDSDVYEKDYFCAVEAKCRVVRSGGKRSDGSKDEWHFEQLLTSKKHPILEWWQQLCSSKPVQVDKKIRFLVFSKTSGIAKAYIAVGRTDCEFIQEAGVSLHAIPRISFEVGRSEDPQVLTETLSFFSFTEFLKRVDPKPLQKLWREKNGFGS